MTRALAALLLVVSPLAACSDDGGDTGSTSPSTTGPAIGDHTCDDPVGDVYLASDDEARPTGRAPGIDIVLGEAVLEGDELTVRFETAGPVDEELFPELIVFGGPADDANRFELRAVGSPDGWAVRRVTFVDGPPVDAALQASVDAHGNVIEFTVRAGLLPLDEFISFAFATTGNDEGEAVNDECFPFVGRTPVGA